MDVVERYIVTRLVREALHPTGAATIYKRQVAEDYIADVCTGWCRFGTTAGGLATLVTTLNLHGSAWLASSQKVIRVVNNVSDVATIRSASLDMDTKAPLTGSLVHVVPRVSYVLHTTTDAAADRNTHTTAKVVVSHGDILGGHTFSIVPRLTGDADTREDSDVVIATVDVVVLDQHVLAAVHINTVAVETRPAAFGLPWHLDFHVVDVQVRTVNGMKRPKC